ncbi:MAG: fluoride efflux transporter CrcB [Bacteroidetes bacterium]|nr:fluoride efflux transporter CrcB [Bacteroidota bacterium]
MFPYFFVFIGGGAGSVVRFLFSVLFTKLSLDLPLATLCSNVLSCLIFALAWLYVGTSFSAPSSIKLLLITGFCGGLSTFSTFSFETFELLRRGDYLIASVNILLNLLLCLTLFALFAKKGM